MWQRAIIKKAVIKRRIGREIWVQIVDDDGNRVGLQEGIDYWGKKVNRHIPVNITQQGGIRCLIAVENLEMCSGPDDFRSEVDDIVLEDSIWMDETREWEVTESWSSSRSG